MYQFVRIIVKSVNCLLQRLFISTLFYLPSLAYPDSEWVDVQLDVLPPYTYENGTGISYDLFRAIEKTSLLKFRISLEHYDTAKLNLRRKKIDIVGHTLYEKEVPAFYKFAQEFDLKFPILGDLYTTDLSYLQNLKELKIGTLRGTRQITASLTGAPIENIVAFSNWDNMFVQLKKGKLDAVFYERSTSFHSIRKQKLEGIYFQQTPKEILYLGYAASTGMKGDKLREKIESGIQSIDTNAFYKTYESFLKIPEQGLVEEYFDQF